MFFRKKHLNSPIHRKEARDGKRKTLAVNFDDVNSGLTEVCCSVVDDTDAACPNEGANNDSSTANAGQEVNPALPNQRQTKLSFPQQQQQPVIIVPFWMSESALPIYTIALLAILTQQTFVLYGIHCVVLHKVTRLVAAWIRFAQYDDPATMDAYRHLRRVLGRLLRHGEQALYGNYGRQVVVAYLLHACTAPGESTIAYVLRYKMHMLNHQWLEELESHRERHRGYAAAKSERNAFS